LTDNRHERLLRALRDAVGPAYSPMEMTLDIHVRGEAGADDESVTNNAVIVLEGALIYLCEDELFAGFRQFLIDLANSDPPQPDLADFFAAMTPPHLAMLVEAIVNSKRVPRG
jgi:hypothetical protein